MSQTVAIIRNGAETLGRLDVNSYHLLGMQSPNPVLPRPSSAANNSHHHEEYCKDWSLFMATPDYYQSIKEGRNLIAVIALQVINHKTSTYINSRSRDHPSSCL